MTNFDMTYTTPDAVARYLQVADPNAVPNSAQQAQYQAFFDFVTDAVWSASAMIDTYTSNKFAPYVDARQYRTQDYLYRNTFRYGRFQLDAYLLELTSVSWIGQTLASDQYYLSPPNMPPYADLFVDRGAVDISTEFADTITVTGVWGDHPDYTRAYSNVTTLSAGINASTTTVAVTSASALENLHYIRVGSELMQVVSISTNTLTVRRGVNGFTAAAHDNGAVVQLYQPRRDLQDACTRIASWLYQHRNDIGDRVQFADGTVVIASLPIIVRQVLARLVYQRSVVI